MSCQSASSVVAMKSKAWFGLALFLWITVVAVGMALVAKVQYTPKIGIMPASTWPRQSAIRTMGNKPVLLMFVHPRCPCSRATMGELARIMTRSLTKVEAVVLFLKPGRSQDDWEKTDLWETARSIPGVTVLVDRGGFEASLFRASVSGETLLYDTDGKLVFNGGVTSARGHAGDNDGEDAILSYLSSGKTERKRTPFFGCSLREDNSVAKGGIDDAWR